MLQSLGSFFFVTVVITVKVSPAEAEVIDFPGEQVESSH